MENYDFLDEDEEEAAPVAPPARQLKAPRSAAVVNNDQQQQHQIKVVHKVVDEKAVKRAQRKRLRSRLLRLAVLSYILLVAGGGFCFAWLGCLCETMGTCGDFTLARDIGIDWCVATGSAVSAHLYVTLPMAVWIARYYHYMLALRLVAIGAALGTAITLLLALAIQGKDPPPGFGLSGVPTGAALVAGFGAWLLFSAAVLGGYYRNKVLGRTCAQASAYLVVCVGVGVLAAFELHLLVGIAVPLVLLFVMGWTAQVWLTTSQLRLTVLAWLAPLAVGTALGVPAEFLPGRFGMPPSSGYAIGLGAAVLATVALSHAYDLRGIEGARKATLMLLVQDIIGLASWTAGYHLWWPTGVLMAVALELMLLASLVVADREGAQFGAWQGGYSLVLMVFFTSMLNTVYELDWTSSVTVGTSVCAAVSALVFLGFWRGGVLWGMRFIFITFLCLVQSNLILIEYVVIDIAAAFAIGFGSIAFVLLLGALLMLFRYDDGAGALYGSGVEGLGFVMSAQTFTYGSGMILYTVLGASDANAHMAAAILGMLVLVCPTLTQYLANSAINAKRNFQRGAVIAGALALLWLTAVLLLRLAFGVATGLAIQVCSSLTLGFVVVMCLSILRFLATVLLVFQLYLALALGSIVLIFTTYTPTAPVVVVSGFAAIGLGLPLVLAWPLARQRAAAREEIAIDQFAARLKSLEQMEREAKANKPTGHRAKHVEKAKRLAARAAQGTLPKLLDLSHNGVMERAGTVRWCNAAGDGRPVLPLKAQTIVCRGSFLYLFPSEGALLPTSRAVAAIPLYRARALTLPEYYDDRMPPLKHLIDLRLSIPWDGKLRIYLQFRDAAQMRTWHADLTKRAHEDSSRSAFRETILEQAVQPDPSLAEGMAVVRKAMARAVTTTQRRAVSKGITREGGEAEVDEALHAAAAMEALERGVSRSDDPRWLEANASGRGGGGGGHGRRAHFREEARYSEPKHVLGETVARMGAKQHVTTRIGKAVRRRQEQQQMDQELCATSTFSSHVVYTPRGISGTADDPTLLYPVEKRRYPSLAASAREVVELNEQMDADEFRQYTDWLAGRGPRPSDAIVQKY